ncbi:MAG: hypothetical protein CM1200mP2_47890 [Planctomycetaceae bacterium]|nr:MAG: hypothetical protein CM1200mP2_47890 [Planctomycetaceae bacterium]
MHEGWTGLRCDRDVFPGRLVIRLERLDRNNVFNQLASNMADSSSAWRSEFASPVEMDYSCLCSVTSRSLFAHPIPLNRWLTNRSGNC